jgi:hypothetical protein
VNATGGVDPDWHSGQLTSTVFISAIFTGFPQLALFPAVFSGHFPQPASSAHKTNAQNLFISQPCP